MLNIYSYTGPVMEFNQCIADRWTGTTRAASESKARSNLLYQFKKATNRGANTKITMPGVIKMVNQEVNYEQKMA